jgi:hypothetical protein
MARTWLRTRADLELTGGGRIGVSATPGAIAAPRCGTSQYGRQSPTSTRTRADGE